MENKKELEKFLALPIEDRLKKSQKYSDQKTRVPILLVNKHKAFELSGIKYLIPKKYTITKLIQMIKKNNKFAEDQSITLQINNTLLKPSQTIEDIAEKQLAKDGFLYIEVNILPTFEQTLSINFFNHQSQSRQIIPNESRLVDRIDVGAFKCDRIKEALPEKGNTKQIFCSCCIQKHI